MVPIIKEIILNRDVDMPFIEFERQLGTSLNTIRRAFRPARKSGTLLSSQASNAFGRAKREMIAAGDFAALSGDASASAGAAGVVDGGYVAQ